MATWVLTFFNMLPAFSICSLWDLCFVFSIPNLVNSTLTPTACRFFLEILTLDWTLTPRVSSVSGHKGPLPWHFRLHNGKHFYSRYELRCHLSLKAISLMHEGQLSPMWLIVVTVNLPISMSSPLLLKGIALPLLFITWDKERPISKQISSNQNILLLCLRFQQRQNFYGWYWQCFHKSTTHNTFHSPLSACNT